MIPLMNRNHCRNDVLNGEVRKLDNVQNGSNLLTVLLECLQS
jgi:hypothetical protein